MRTVDLIRIKREGGRLSAAQIGQLIRGCAEGTIPDYQLSAWLMAVYFRGMSGSELAALTRAMMDSGEVYDLGEVEGPKIDKHSTGGVGDKVSLILAPLAAACGLIVPMISGRGLGHTGGTLDKLESIPGFTTRLTRTRFIRQLSAIGVAMGGQTARFVPADRKLYALRDVTSTVESIPLIAASIMSKKLAEGCEGLVLDVKTGNGAFMAKTSDAVALAKAMVGIGRRMGRNVSAMITDMNQPLGRAVGAANEVAESIECLQGDGPPDLMEVTLALTARMIVLGGVEGTERKARARIDRALGSGAALDRFRALIQAQGGDPRCVDDPKKLPRARKKAVIAAPKGGFLTRFDTRAIGVSAMTLGAGRETMTDTIDPGAGLWVRARLGDAIGKGEPVFELAYNEPARLEQARAILKEAFRIGPQPPARMPKLIHRRSVR